jgi:hypothetical protein
MSWTSIKKFSEVLVQIKSLQHALETHLVDRPESQLLPSVSQWVNREAILQYWIKEHPTLNEAPQGRSTADLLFVLLCYAQAAGGSKLAMMPPEQDAADLLGRVQAYGTLLTDGKIEPGTADILFKDCAAMVVRQLHHAPSETLETTRGFGIDYGDPQDEYKGDNNEDSKEQEEEQEVNIQEVKSLKLARALLPNCTRVFLERWHADALWAQLDADMEFDKSLIHPAKHKLTEWIASHFKYEMPRAFNKLFETWMYRMATPIGAVRLATRPPGSGNKKFDARELYQRDKIATTLALKKWNDETKALALLGTPVEPWAVLAGFASLFDARYSGANFAQEYIVLHDELLDKRDKILTATIGQGRPRRPLILQFPSGKWAVQDGNKKKIDCADVYEALLVWMLLMKLRYRSTLGNFVAVDAWIADFYQ